MTFMAYISFTRIRISVYMAFLYRVSSIFLLSVHFFSHRGNEICTPRAESFPQHRKRIILLARFFLVLYSIILYSDNIKDVSLKKTFFLPCACHIRILRSAALIPMPLRRFPEKNIPRIWQLSETCQIFQRTEPVFLFSEIT